MKIFAILLVIVLQTRSQGVSDKSCGHPQAFRLSGDVHIALLVHQCDNSEILVAKTSINTAIWTVERLNSLEYTAGIHLGLSVFTLCKETEYLSSIFKVFREGQERSAFLGAIIDEAPSRRVEHMREVLGVESVSTTRFWGPLVKATVKLMEVLEWKENITVVASNSDVLREFYKYTRKQWMCVRSVLDFDANGQLNTEHLLRGPTAVFGDSHHIRSFMNQTNTPEIQEDLQLILIPLDGNQIADLPESVYVIQPYHPEYQIPYSTSASMIPSPLLLEVANPIITYADYVRNKISKNCTDHPQKNRCIRNATKAVHVEDFGRILEPQTIADVLEIDVDRQKFRYDIFKVENISIPSPNQTSYVLQSFVKVFSYDIFSDTLTDLETKQEINTTYVVDTDHVLSRTYEECILECINYINLDEKFNASEAYTIRLRTEPWIFGFWVVSFLGMIFCISVMIFLLVKIFKRDILEGNPVLTLLLVISTFAMYLSVFPFTLIGDKHTQSTIYITRALCITLSYAATFSLMLGRSILLSSVSKELRFMSHIEGMVQAFMSLFIFGVQCALSVSIIDHHQEIFQESHFLYILSYNMMLLALLMCFAPLIMRSRRNYKEGKYFAIASLLNGCCWCCWIPAYVLLGDAWRDPLLCFGLVATASVVLGTVFIPRTYLVTIAETRDKITNALPALATVASNMDIYVGNGQPIYDCINVAAINAANVLRSTISEENGNACEDFYSPPTVRADDDDDNYDFPRSPTPITADDKVTRF